MVAAISTLKINQYQRRQPEDTLLYRTVKAYWPMFVSEQAKVGKRYPLFIHQEFDEFLRCGIPEYGFVRTYCYQCRYSGVVAFSCKRRGFCPSCAGKRMNDGAFHLIQNVIPKVTTRQWVLSFPWKIRFIIANNPKLTNELLRIFINSIDQFQRKKIKNKKAKIGAITFIQRFGSALNLNVHFHTLISDGVFISQENGVYSFQRLPQPTKEELQKLINKIKMKSERKIKKYIKDDQLPFDEEALDDVAKLSIEQKAAFGERQGKRIRQYGIKSIEVDPENNDPATANESGYSLNARVWIAKNERKKLEHVLRYMGRGPISQERMTDSFPNQILYKLKTPWRDGTTHVSFSKLDFIARLVALIPPPRMNMIRYHGVFAPNFKSRRKIVPQKEKEKSKAESESNPNQKLKSERLNWAKMLKRTFEIDVTVCPKCQGRLEQIAVIKDRAVITAILKSLGELTQFQSINPVTTGPPEEQSNHEEIDQRNDDW